MIDFIKEYGVTTLDYEYIMHNIKQEIIEHISLSENSVREVLAYYNEIGITYNIGKILVMRPDLILTSKENLEEQFSKVNKEVLVSIIDKSVEDLILLGI